MPGDAPEHDAEFGLARDFYTFAPESLAQELPDYEVVREVGKGSMGIVYEARDRRNGATVALKILPPSLTLTERALARFLREGRIMSRVRHPDIVGFVDQGRRGRLHWFAMDFVSGTTLEQRLEVGPLPVVTACRIAARVGRALQYAHDHGVVHRDIKPGNLMLRDGDGDDAQQVAITDFGLARETGTGSMTESGAIVGTPMYMAPEVVLGGTQAATTLADVYSLGATLYALVTGEPPFDGPTAQGVLKAVTEQDPRPARRLRADLPVAVEAIVEKAMARDPAHRYGSALELAEDLERFLAGERVLARRAGPLRRAARYCARRPLMTALFAAVLALSIGALWLVGERHDNELRRGIAETERLLALASTSRDEQDRQRTEAERRDFLLQAVARASASIALDHRAPEPWVLRARAQLRLGHLDRAVLDLDQAEKLADAAAPELLMLRIEALRGIADATAQHRLQQDLTSLLALDQSPRTRTLVADHLLDFAAMATRGERRAALDRVEQVLAPVGDDDARAAVARARRLELEGAKEAAVAAMRRALQQHDGNLYVHLQAAAMFDRNDLTAEGAREHELASRLEPGAGAGQPTAPVDLGGLDRFLRDVGTVLHTLDGGAAAGSTPDGGRER
ncbi:MAG: protein kinase [Planctomycetes bacterium]|nr:protein kinase [Planctomycetota bacterium]